MSHDHDHPISRSPGSQNKWRLVRVLLLTAAFMGVETVAGFMTGSLALLADAGHMLTDAGGLGLALVGIILAERPATPSKTYGFYRVEILSAAMNAVLLLGISAMVLWEAVQRLRHPVPVQGGVMMGVAVAGLCVNVAGVFLLKGGADQSLNLKGAYFEVLSDAIASVGVLIAAAVISLTGWTYADPLISVGIGLFIVPRTWHLLSEAVDVLLEGTPADIDLVALRAALCARCLGSSAYTTCTSGASRRA